MIRSALFACLCLFIFQNAKAARVVLPNQNAPLTKASPDTNDGRRILKEACDKLGALQISSKAVCKSFLESSNLISRAAADFCLSAGGMSYLESCLKMVENRRIDESVLEVCSQVASSDRSRKSTGRAECLRYFEVSQSSYDKAAAQYCVKRVIGVFRDSLSCLEFIRDREVDLSKMKSECDKKTDIYIGIDPETFNQCMSRVVGEAPIRKDPLCAPGAATKNEVKNPGSGLGNR